MDRPTTVFLFLLCCDQLHPQFPATRTFPIEGSTLRMSVQHIEQDATGGIWLGTDNGLLKFNGETKTLNITDQPVLAMSSYNGRVIAAMDQGMVISCQGIYCDTILLDTMLVNTAVRDLLLDQDGKLWLAHYGEGVVVIEQDRQIWYRLQSGLLDDHVKQLVELQDGRIAAATDQGVALIDYDGSDSATEHVTSEHGLSDELVTALYVQGDTLWIGMQRDGVAWLVPGGDQVKIPPGAEAWPFGMVTSFAMSNDEFWVGTQHHGPVKLYFGDRLGHNKPDADDLKGKVHDLFMDPDGALWWSLGNEVLNRSEVGVQLIAWHEGFSFDSLATLCASNRGTFFAGQGRRLIEHPMEFNDLNTLQQYTDFDPGADIVSLHQDERGSLWVGTFGAGLSMIGTDGTVQHFGRVDGLSDENILAISSGAGELWLATLGGICRADLSGPVPRFSTVQASSSGFVYDIQTTSAGDVFAATDGAGVLGVEPTGNVTRYLKEEEQRTFYSLVLGGGAVWAVGPGTGLCRIQNGRSTCYGKDAAELDEVFAACYLHDRIVILTGRGLLSFDPATERMTTLTGALQIDQPTSELNAMLVDPQSKLWIGSDAGLYNINITKEQLDGTVPTFIEGVSASGVPVSLKGLKGLPHDKNYLTFHFHGRNYSSPSAVRFHYQLKGYDESPAITRDREVSYSKLPPGRYTFTVSASLGNEARAGRVAMIDVTILAPFWERSWFILMMIALVAFLAFGLIRFRDRARQREQAAERDRMRFQFEALSSQVNPHFLFNSFNILMELIEESKDKAIDHVQDLSDLFRSMLKVRDRDLITLKEDLKLLSTYVQLEKRRFGDRIQLEQRVEPDQLQSQVAPLTTQLLVENAIKHTRFNDKEPLHIQLDARYGWLQVSNPYRPKATKANSTGYGLQSIEQRYGMLSDRAVQVVRTQQQFTVRIPLLSP